MQIRWLENDIYLYLYSGLTVTGKTQVTGTNVYCLAVQIGEYDRSI